ATYYYRNRDGQLLYRIFRKERFDAAGEKLKTFTHDPPGHEERVLYRWPEIVAAGRDATLFVTEGEKDADRVASLGFIATTVASGNWDGVDVSDIKDRDVNILEDADKTGVDKALKAAKALRRVAKTIRIVRLPGQEYTAEKRGKDVSDWLDEDPSRTADA